MSLSVETACPYKMSRNTDLACEQIIENCTFQLYFKSSYLIFVVCEYLCH